MNNTMHKDEFRIGKYRLLELLSEGRYTDIWLAEHISSHCVIISTDQYGMRQ